MNASTATAPAAGNGIFRRWWFWLPLLLCLLAGAFLGLKYSSFGKQIAVGTGYAAHVVCSCRYVGNRDMASCKTDFEPGMEAITVTEDPDQRSITASVPLLSRRTARFDPEYGCALDKP